MPKNLSFSGALVRLVQEHRRQTVAMVGVLAVVVAALLAFGVSERSAAAQSEPETVGAVTDLTATAEGQPPGTVHLTWNAAEYAQVHFVYYIEEKALNARNWAVGQMRAYNGTEATIDGLAGGETYYFAARGMRWHFGESQAVWGDWLYWETATPSAVTQIPGREYLYQPIQTPQNLALIQWHYQLGLDNFREWVIDFTIHDDVGDFSDQHGLYLRLGSPTLSEVGLSFGLQTDAWSPDPPHRRGKAVIFSRGGTTDVANARFDDWNGWTEFESSEREGDSIGVLKSYDWGAGSYRIRIIPDGLDADGEWFGLWITDLATDETTWIGSLKFPLLKGKAGIMPVSTSAIQIYGSEPIRPIDIPQWHVSIRRPLASVKGWIDYTSNRGYPYEIENSDIWYDSSEDMVHLRVGGTTERANDPVRWIDFKPVVDISGLPFGAWLEQNKPVYADRIKRLPWVADGIDEAESEGAEALIYSVVVSTALTDRILEKSWVQDGITSDEATVLWSFYGFVNLTEESLRPTVIAKAIEILAMPFLDSVESEDLISLELSFAIERCLSESETLAQEGVDYFSEKRNIELPLSGDVLLTVIRLHDQMTLSMGFLEHSVRAIEDFMKTPYPTTHVALMFCTDLLRPGAGGGHFGTHIVMHSLFDVYDDEGWGDSAPGAVAHEVGHYYWTGNRDWLDEGAASLLDLVSENERTGAPIDVPDSSCAAGTTIAELEGLDPDFDDPEFACNYFLGASILWDLHQALGKETFREGFRRLYLRSQQHDPTDNCEGMALGICHVEVAFKDGASDGIVDKVDEIVARWYGTVP